MILMNFIYVRISNDSLILKSSHRIFCVFRYNFPLLKIAHLPVLRDPAFPLASLSGLPLLSGPLPPSASPASPLKSLF